MLRKSIEASLQWLKRVITQPRDELSRWQRAARFAYDLGKSGARQLQYDRAPQMAAALAFRALFGLVPVLVVATVAVRALIGIDEFLDLVTHLLAWASLDEVTILRPPGAGPQAQTLSAWLETLIGEAASVNLAAIGWIGMAVVIYAAIGLLASVEDTFNIIYRVPDGRSWLRRVPLYWFVLTVCPIGIGLAVWLNGRIAAWLEMAAGWQGVPYVVGLLWSCFCGWMCLLAVYMLMPNTAVKFRAAAAGAVVGVILLEIGKRLLATALGNAFSVNQLYGSLGLIPLFMFWVYLMCLALLFGLQVSASLQMLHGRRLEEIERTREMSGLVEPSSLIAVMEVIANRFHAGQRTGAGDVAEAVGISRSTAREVLCRLVEAGLLHRLDRDNEAVCLARSPEQITADELLDVGFRMADASGARRSPFYDRLRDAQRELAKRRTLAALVTSTPS